MSGTRITIDGLWRCLCPSVDEPALFRALRSPAPLPSRLPSRATGRQGSICTARWRARPLHTTSHPCTASTAEAEAPQNSGLSSVSRQGGRTEQSTTADDILKAPGGPPRELLHLAPTPVIYDALRIMQSQPKRRPHLRALVKYLVQHRSQAPNAFLYEALIASNWEPAGSAEEVREILDEMRNLGVSTTSSLYHTALRALAIHPDYLLRNRIISEMKERWLELTPDGEHSVALGLLRDGQHELAVEKLEGMLDVNRAVPSWVLDIFIVVLSQHAHFDEALSLLQRRTQSDRPALSPNIWSFVLDECSRYYHYTGTRLAWDTLVPSKLLTPSDGTCLNVLNTASRHSDARLATDVVSHLSARQVKLGAHHYEALVDCYAHRDDVSNALEALCIMSRAGVPPSQPSTSSILAAFRRSPSLVRVARDALLRLGETFTVPLAAFNAVLDGLCAFGGDGDAFELYQHVRHLCGCAPDYHTFRPVMERGWDVGIAGFLLDEMRAFGVEPTREFYDRLVYLAAVQGDLDTAFKALGELERRGGGDATRRGKRRSGARAEEWWIGRETALAVVRRCVSDRDERVWNLLWFARTVGLDLGPAGRALAESVAAMREEWAREESKEEGKKERKSGGEGDDSKKVERESPPWLRNAFFEKRVADGGAGSG